MTSTVAPEEHNDTEEQTVIGRATTVVADVGARVQTAAGDALRLAYSGIDDPIAGPIPSSAARPSSDVAGSSAVSRSTSSI